jgi:hypothetical protein
MDFVANLRRYRITLRNLPIQKIGQLFISEIFRDGIIFFVVLTCIEILKNGVITRYFNLNILLYIIIVAGLLTFILPLENES